MLRCRRPLGAFQRHIRLTDVRPRPLSLILYAYPTMRTWMCLICGWIYDESAGLPDEGIPAGTPWEDVPPNWVCPECGARKEDFEMVEI